MSRSDGKFPEYEKLNISPDKWPANFWDNNNKCSSCGKGWPNHHLFEKSICCGASTTTQDGPPDMRWPEAVYDLLEKYFDQFYNSWNENKSDDELVWEDVKTNGQLDTEKVSEAVEELIERPKVPHRPYTGIGH